MNVCLNMEDHTPHHGGLKLSVFMKGDHNNIVNDWRRCRKGGSMVHDPLWPCRRHSMAVGEFVSVSTQRDIEKISLMTKNSHENTNPVQNLKNQKPRSIIVLLEDNHHHFVLITVMCSPARSPVMRVISEGTLRGGEIEKFTSATLSISSCTGFGCGVLMRVICSIGVWYGCQNNKMSIYEMVMEATLALAVFGGFGAYLGGSKVKISVVMVLFGGWVSMGITYGLLKSFGHHDHD